MNAPISVGASSSPGRLGRLLRAHGLLLAVLAAYAVLAVLSPATSVRAAHNAWRMLTEIGLLLLGVYLFLGVFEEWISPATLSRHIGSGAGRVRALAIATVVGAWGTGPVYVTYPLATLLFASTARIATAVAFMSAWQVVKLTMLPFEIQFLGARFALLRVACCALVPIPAGILTEAVMRALHLAPRRAGGAQGFPPN